MKSSKGRKEATGGGKPYLTLTEAVAAAVIVPGGLVRVGIGSMDPQGRLDPDASRIIECRIDAFDLIRNTVTVFCSQCDEISPEDDVKLAIGMATGLYLAEGNLLSSDSTEQGSRLITLWVGGLRWIEEREYVRVSIPGARVTCRTQDRIMDCPVGNISACGLLITGTGPLIPGTELSIRLTIPLTQNADIYGEVVWNDVLPTGESRAGIKFTRIPPQFQARLANLCMLYHAFYAPQDE